jgi:hypothetical protein
MVLALEVSAGQKPIYGEFLVELETAANGLAILRS